MTIKAIDKAFRRMVDKRWEKTYWAIDLHETVIKPNWKVNDIPTSFYPMARETLQLISARQDIVTIMYTCSHPHEIRQYQELFAAHNIHFDYINENPEVANSGFGYYDKKPYFNVLLEDKAGFDAYEDWQQIFDYLQQQANEDSMNQLIEQKR